MLQKRPGVIVVADAAALAHAAAERMLARAAIGSGA
jgi:hypothetical protein